MRLPATASLVGSHPVGASTVRVVSEQRTAVGTRRASQPFARPWSASTQLRTADVEAMQRHLTRIGLYSDKVDGKAGMKTRAALGAYQKSAGLTVDCWPSEAVLRSISAAR